MSNKPITPGTGPQEISAESAEGIAGGDCSLAQLEQITASLKDSYENLVDFVSHVIGRVAGN